jgi:biopolymer transport protein ExbD
MAFNTDSSSNREAMSEINVTPLVDVMLVLLVVFIVTAPLLTQAVKVDLPKTAKTDPAPDKHLATVSIDAQGRISLDEQAQPLEALEAELKKRQSADPELTVQFQADQAVPYGRVAEAMAVAHKAGIGKLAFMTRE